MYLPTASTAVFDTLLAVHYFSRARHTTLHTYEARIRNVYEVAFVYEARILVSKYTKARIRCVYKPRKLVVYSLFTSSDVIDKLLDYGSFQYLMKDALGEVPLAW